MRNCAFLASDSAPRLDPVHGEACSCWPLHRRACPHIGHSRPWSSTQSVNFQSSVVGKAVEPVMFNDMMGLDLGIAFQRGRIFDNLFVATDVGQALNAVAVPEHFLELFHLVGVVCGEDQHRAAFLEAAWLGCPCCKNAIRSLECLAVEFAALRSRDGPHPARGAWRAPPCF